MKLIKLTRGLFAQVDDADYEWLNQWKWHAIKSKHTFYVGRNSSRKEGKRTIIKMHRLIMDTPKGMDVDHQDHNGLNCQRHNMRNCTRTQNQANKTPRGRSKFLGVLVCGGSGRNKGLITAQIQSNHQKVHLGCFETEEEAAKAYDKAAKLHHGEFANLNFK